VRHLSVRVVSVSLGILGGLACGQPIGAIGGSWGGTRYAAKPWMGTRLVNGFVFPDRQFLPVSSRHFRQVKPLNTADNWIAGSGNWGLAANWSAGVPGASSAVTIGNTPFVTVTEDLASAIAASLTLTNSDSLYVSNGNSLAVSGTATISSSFSSLNVGYLGRGGGTLTSGSLSNGGALAVGNSSNTGPTAVTVNGTLTNAGGYSVIDVSGGVVSAAHSLLKISGPAPATLIGAYNVLGSIGSAAVQFGSGTVISIGDGVSNSGYLALSGSNAYFETGATKNTSALNGLTTINNNGVLYILNGASVTTTGALSNAGSLMLDGMVPGFIGSVGGSSLTVGGSLTNTNSLQVGDGATSSPSTLKANGTLTNIGGTVSINGGSAAATLKSNGITNIGGTVSINGGSAAAGNSLLNVAGAAPITLTGTYNLLGAAGSAAMEFGSGTVTGIGDGVINPGFLLLSGSNAYFETGATNSNSGLTGLTIIAHNGGLALENGASVTTAGALNNSGTLGVDGPGSSGGSNLTLGGSLSSSNSVQVGDGFTSSPSTLKVNGTVTNASGTIAISGGTATAGSSLLNVTGAAPPTLTGTYTLLGNAGSAAMEFASGTVNSIGDGASNAGDLSLSGSNSYFETGATNSNSALTGLTSIANNGTMVLANGAPVTTTAALNNSGSLEIDVAGTGGSSLTLGGSLTNTHSVQIGNASASSPSSLKVNGTLTNTGGTLTLNGGGTPSANSLVSITGAAPTTLTGNYNLLGSVGSAVVEFGSGGVTAIGDGASNAGDLVLSGSNAYFQTGPTNNNSALTGLATIAQNGTLALNNGASVTTTVALNNAGTLQLNPGSLTLGGALTNTGSMTLYAPANLNVNGTLTNTGGTLTLNGGGTASASSLVNVTGAAPATLTGTYNLLGSAGSAAVNFSSGTVIRIGDGAGNAGSLVLSGSNAYFESGASNSNSVLTSLTTINNNGQLLLQNGASVTTTTALNNAGILGVDESFYSGGSSLTLGGSLTNTNQVQVGNVVNFSSPSTLKVNGTLTNAAGVVSVAGGFGGGMVNVTGAAPAILTGTYNVLGGSGPAAVQFGSGGVAAIGDGASAPGYLLLSGSTAYFETGATNSNSALNGLTTINSNGQLHLQNFASVTTSGAVTNSGSLMVDDSGAGGSNFINNGSSFTNNALVQIGSAGTSSQSSLTVAGTLRNNSAGTITVSGASFGGSAVLAEAGPSIVNSGTINLTGSGGTAVLQIGANTTLSGSGTLSMSNIETNLITGTSPTLTFTNSSTIQGSGTISSMGIVNTGTMLANQSTPMIILPSSAGLNNKGTLNVSAGDTMQIGTSAGGALTNFSGMTLKGGNFDVSGTLQFGAPGTSLVTNNAHINLTGAGSQVIDFGGGNILAGFATNNKGASFTLGIGRNFTTAGNFTNNGTLTIGAGDAFKINGNLTNFSGGTLTGGTYNVGGILQFNGANIVTNAASITLSGTGSQIISEISANALANFAMNASTGAFMLASNQNLTTAGGSFTNAGALTIKKGSIFTVGGSSFNFTQTGGTSTIDGKLTSSAAGTLTLNGGSLFGGGTLGFAITDAATITPGDSSTKTGILTVSSTYTQSSNGVLDMSIGGTTQGTQYDELKVSGAATLNGTLNISLVNKFTPTVGQTFDILNGASLTGAFSTINGLSINSSEHFSPSQSATDIILTVVSGPSPTPAFHVGLTSRWRRADVLPVRRSWTAASTAPAPAIAAPQPHHGSSFGMAMASRTRRSDAGGSAVLPALETPGPIANTRLMPVQAPTASFSKTLGPNPSRFECGVDLGALLKTSPRKLWHSFVSDSPAVANIGYVAMIR